jgi:3-oxoacyl-[acyl-carrier protein] reductase
MRRSRTAIVTGAGRGIGRAIATRLSLDGHVVALVSRTESELLEVQSDIQERGGSALVLTADVSAPASVDEVVATVLQRTGQIDVLVNNAGISPTKNGGAIPVVEMEVADWNTVLAVNLTSQFLFCRCVAPGMIERRSGIVINIASAAARTGGIIAGAHYVASKAGVIGLTKVLARELGRYSIRVNCIAPGRVATPMLDAVSVDPLWAEQNVPLGRIGVPDEVADVVAFLASDGARYIHGATLDVNGGWIMY